MGVGGFDAPVFVFGYAGMFVGLSISFSNLRLTGTPTSLGFEVV